MEELSNGQVLDMILKFCLENEKVGFISSDYLQKNLLSELNEDELLILFQRINNSHDKIAEVVISDYTTAIRANGLTEGFIEQGGFTQIENDEMNMLQRKQDIEELDYRKSKVDLALAEKMLKEFPKTKWFARIGFIIGIGLAILELIKYIKYLTSSS